LVAVDPAKMAVARFLGDLQAQLDSIQDCADALAVLVDGGRAADRIGELRERATRAAEIARGLANAYDASPSRLPRDLNEVIRAVKPTLTAIAGVSVVLRLSDSPILVASHVGELERLVVNLVLNTSTSMAPAGGLTLATDLVSNPSSAGTTLPRGRYARLVVTDAPAGAAASGDFAPATAPWTAGQLEGRVAVQTNAAGGTTVSLLLPLIAAL
jgi:signal transduction histidine kinase